MKKYISTIEAVVCCAAAVIAALTIRCCLFAPEQIGQIMNMLH